MKSGDGSGWNAMRTFSLGLLLLVGLQLARASSVVNGGNYSVGGNRQGFAGDPVSLSISESDLLGFVGAQLHFSFDANVLSYVGSLPADPASAIFPSVSCDPSPSDCSLFLLTGLGAVDGSHQLFTLNFKITAAAPPGMTLIRFSNDIADFSDPAVTGGIYDRQLFQGTTIQILAVPEPASQALMLGGLAALALLPLSRRFRFRAKTKQTAASPPG